MEETLTLTRVIDNINHVYGTRLVEAIFVFLLAEVVLLVIVNKKIPSSLAKFKILILFVATIVSAILAWRAKPYVAYDKFERSTTICSAKNLLNQKSFEEFKWADSNIYNYHYYNVHKDELESDDFEEKFGKKNTKLAFEKEVLCKETPREYLLQICACFLVYATGFFFVRCFFDNRYNLLSLFLGVPIGASIIVLVTILILFFHIKYNWISVFTILFIIWIGIAAVLKRKHIKFNKATVMSLVVALMIIVFSTYVRFYQFSGDSRWQLILAMNLVDEGYFSKWLFAQATTFGFLGIGLHAFAILFGIDYLYAYYLLFAISGVGIFISAGWMLSKNKQIRLAYILGLIVLLANFDYEYYSFSILSNGAMGICIFSIVILTLIANCRGGRVSALMALMSFALLTTRIEGVCYVALLMVIPFERSEELKKATIISGVEIVLWQIAQYMYSDGTGLDGWTPTTGIALLLVGALLIVEPYLIRINFINKLKNNYKIVYIFLILIIIGIGFCYDYNMASDNVAIFLSHLSVSRYSNSLSFWSFLLFLLPLAVENSLKDEGALLFIILAYFLMVFGISIFRTGNPLNTQISDSFRRIICQMMLMSIWLTVYYIGENDETSFCG